MAETRKILAQSYPGGTGLTDVYTVPGTTQAVVSTVTICNQNTTDTTFRLAVAEAGAGDNAKQYLLYDEPLPAKSTYIATIGMTLGAADVVRVNPGNSNCSINVFGVELT